MRTAILLACLVASVPSAALSQGCPDLWRAPSGEDVRVGIAAVSKRGHILYAKGQLRHIPRQRLPNGTITPARWVSPPDSTALQAYSDQPNASRGDAILVPPPASVSVSIAERLGPLGRVRGIAVVLRISRPPFPSLRPVEFAATCTANGLVQGTAGETDYLIYIARTRPSG